jgi:dethiobiotin synthetase
MSLRGYFIAGTDTGAGKTRVTVGLLGALRDMGVPARGMKAVASGADAMGRNEDAELIRGANARSLVRSTVGTDDENPYCFQWPISPHLAARRAGVSIAPERILAAARRLAAENALILVEGTGGWLAPTGPGQTMADIAAALGLPVVLVVGLRLGCLNHALLSARAIMAGPPGLAGWIGSQIESGMPALEENVATLDERLPAPRLALLRYSPGTLQDAAQLTDAARALQRGATISL